MEQNKKCFTTKIEKGQGGMSDGRQCRQMHGMWNEDMNGVERLGHHGPMTTICPHQESIRSEELSLM